MLLTYLWFIKQHWFLIINMELYYWIEIWGLRIKPMYYFTEQEKLSLWFVGWQSLKIPHFFLCIFNFLWCIKLYIISLLSYCQQISIKIQFFDKPRHLVLVYTGRFNFQKCIKIRRKCVSLNWPKNINYHHQHITLLH